MTDSTTTPLPDDFHIFGSRISFADAATFPFAGGTAAVAMIPNVGRLAGWIVVAVGAFSGAVIYGISARALTDARYWFGTARIRLLLCLVSFVSSQIFVFSSVYYLLSTGSARSFNEHLGPVSAIYFSISAWTTTGFGDIHPVSSPARLVVSLELLLAVVTVIVLVATAVAKAFSRPS
jgi:hypothetical protein